MFPFFRLLSRLSPGVKQFCLPILDSNQKLWELNKGTCGFAPFVELLLKAVLACRGKEVVWCAGCATAVPAAGPREQPPEGKKGCCTQEELSDLQELS